MTCPRNGIEIPVQPALASTIPAVERRPAKSGGDNLFGTFSTLIARSVSSKYYNFLAAAFVPSQQMLTADRASLSRCSFKNQCQWRCDVGVTDGANQMLRHGMIHQLIGGAMVSAPVFIGVVIVLFTGPVNRPSGVSPSAHLSLTMHTGHRTFLSTRCQSVGKGTIS